MLADNRHHLIQHARQRRQETLERARRALAELTETGQPVTVAELASRAGVSRSWIYTQPELRDQIQQGSVLIPTSTPPGSQ